MATQFFSAAVAESQVAMNAIAEGVLDLAQAAVVTDDESAVARLTTGGEHASRAVRPHHPAAARRS